MLSHLEKKTLKDLFRRDLDANIYGRTTLNRLFRNLAELIPRDGRYRELLMRATTPSGGNTLIGLYITRDETRDELLAKFDTHDVRHTRDTCYSDAIVSLTDFELEQVHFKHPENGSLATVLLLHPITF